MSDRPLSIEERRARRARFLEIVYDATGGDPGLVVNLVEVGAEMGLDHGESWDVRTFLGREGLIQGVTGMGGISITHAGARLVEEWRAGPDEKFRREEDAAGDTINIGTAINAQIQQGTRGSSQEMAVSNQTIGEIRSFLSDLRERLGELEAAGLDAEAAGEIAAQVTTAEGQIASKKTRWDVVKGALLEIKELLEAAKGIGEIATPIVAGAARLIAGL